MNETRRKSPLPARHNLRYDRHGDVVENIDDSCGATVLPSDDMLSARWLAASPQSRNR